MNTKNKVAKSAQKYLIAAPVFAGAIIASMISGCGDDLLDNPLCCNQDDFQVGGTISADAEYSGEVRVALQAVADIGGIASASLDDLTTACRSIAEGLDATQAERDAADANADKRERMSAMCDVALNAIIAFKATAGAELSIDFKPPQCSANISAKASCQGGCSGEAKCDVKANPPTCEGGSLEVSCKGSCSAEAGASVKCEGKCTGGCTGECTAQGGVECAGKCEGTCKGAAEGGTGQGIKADGTCEGTCEGTCKVTAPGVECSGSCAGECDASCEAEAGGSVTCDGSCEGEFEPLKCEGGELKGGCSVEAKCEANCDASVKAKAECTPPSLTIGFAAGASGEAALAAQAKLKLVLEANLGLVASLKSRFEVLASVSGTLVTNVNADFLADIKLACIPVVVAAVANAGGDITATADASFSVLGEVGLGG